MLGSILTASDDDSRPATKRELNLLRLQIRAMCNTLRGNITDELRQRELLGGGDALEGQRRRGHGQPQRHACATLTEEPWANGAVECREYVSPKVLATS